MLCLKNYLRVLKPISRLCLNSSHHSSFKIVESYQCSFSQNNQSLVLPSNFEIVYCHSQNQCIDVCNGLLSSFKLPVVIGCDAEWIPFKERRKVALLQLCVSLEKCYVFHLSQIGYIPQPLLDIIKHRWVVKVGVGIEYDLFKLYNDYLVPERINSLSHIDIGKYANDLGYKRINKPNWSLNNLCELFLLKKVNKQASLRLGNWEEFPLSNDQLEYAAIDAYASLLLFNLLDENRRLRHQPISFFPYIATKLQK